MRLRRQPPAIIAAEASEAELKQAVTELLLWHRCAVFPTDTEGSHQGRNGNYKDGTPDLIVMDWQGRFFALENKREDGELRKSQIAVREEFHSLGFIERYIVLKPSDYVRKLTEAGIIGARP